MSKDKIRLLIQDPTGAMFSDADLDLFLEMEGQNFYGAAALACLSIASNKAKLGKFTLEGYADNEAAAAGLFRSLAKDYREKSITEGDGWAIVEWPSTVFARRRRTWS